MDGVAAVLTRIAEIQSLLGAPAPGAAPSSSGPSSTAPPSPASPWHPSRSPASPSKPAGGFAAVLAGATAPPAAGRSGAAVVADAKKYLGIPYRWGGTNPQVGLDCSGLTQRVYADLGIKLPRTAHEQAKAGKAIPSLAEARPGDLLAFHHPVSHIAIYAGDGMMIVAPHTGAKVRLEKVYTTPSTIRRILPAPPSPAPGSAVPGPPILLAAAHSAPGSVPYASLFNAAGRRYGVSPALLAAVAKVESNYNPQSVSRAGAAGLMQIMPATASSLGIDPFDPAQAVDGAARILASHLRRFGSLDLALAAYNAGAGAVRRYGGVPPYRETRAYIPKVEAALAALGAGEGQAL